MGLQLYTLAIVNYFVIEVVIWNRGLPLCSSESLGLLAKMLEIAHCSTYLIYHVKNLEQECYLSGVSDSPQVVHLAVSEPQFASEVLHQFE